MHIKELTIAEFDAFAKNHPLGSHYQSSNYAILMAELGYDYEFIGYVDELGIIKAASLILIHKINFSHKFGYSPKGFLIDYFDYDLIKSFCEALKNYYKKRLVFIKINPDIAIGEINKKSKLTNYNQNIIIRDYLKEIGFAKLKDNLYFESLFPRFNGIISLEEYDIKKLNKNTRNNIRKAEKRGLTIEKIDRSGIDILFSFIKKKNCGNEYYYKNYYNIFAKNNASDIFLVKIDYEKYLINCKNEYDKELQKNSELAEELIKNANDVNINSKMNSDKALLSYKNNIEIATAGLRENKTTYIAGAFIIKYNNRINIIASGINPAYKTFNANYFLHNELIKYYKKDFKYIDLNGLTGDFSKTNPYKGLNDFKLGYNPHIYEFIGEFDLILNDKTYKQLIKNGSIANIYNQLKEKGN